MPVNVQNILVYFLFLRLRERHNALQLPVFFFVFFFLFFCQHYPEYREFGAKSYFTDYQRANTINGFADSVPVLKIYNCYQDTQTFEQLSISTQALTRQEQCVDVSNPIQTIFKYFKLQLCNYSNCTIDQLLYYWQTFQPIFVAK